MKGKASLVLIEQLIMILVFALAASLCLGVFAGAHQISQQADDLDAAVFLVQHSAEVLKSCNGDLTVSSELLGGTVAGNTIQVTYASDYSVSEDSDYLLYIRRIDPSVPGVGSAEIWAVRTDAPDVVLFSVIAVWQEVLP